MNQPINNELYPWGMAFAPAVVLTRGEIVESIHMAAIAVVDANGRLIASYGNPYYVTFMRSSSKPLQAIPLIEQGGVQAFHLTQQEIALLCASHEGTDLHVQVIKSIQEKTGVLESDLMCGTHPVSDRATAEAMLLRGEKPSPNRHNCSGKHTGFLSQAIMRNVPREGYLDVHHPVQQTVIQTFAEMCQIPVEDIQIGIDGCSAPVFGLPLFNAALGIARLCDPSALSPVRASACRTITNAMTEFPEMVAGYSTFDTQIMRVGQGKIITKRGAEGFQVIGLMPGAIAENSPALGISIKIADGDLKERARPLLSIEVLRQLGALDSVQLAALAAYDTRPISNYRNLIVGKIMPSPQFSLTLSN